MFRFGRIVDGVSASERRKLRQVQAIFRQHFADTPEWAESLPDKLARRSELPYELLLRTVEDGAGHVLGFAVVHVYTKLRSAYLDFIATTDEAPAGGGTGGALYEALREDLASRDIEGLYMDVPPDDPSKVGDPMRLPANARRLAFYERYGARPIINTIYDGPPPLGQDYDPPFLVFDDLGWGKPPSRERARAVMRAILVRKYGWTHKDPYLRKVVDSVVDDPVRLRPPRYIEAQPGKQGKPTPVIPARFERTRPLQVIVSPHHEIHHVKEQGYVERPARVDAILAALASMPMTRVEAEAAPRSAIEAVHSKDLVHYVERVVTQLEPQQTLYPYVFPIRRPDRKPKPDWVKAGYYCIDTFTPLSVSAIAAAHGAVDCAVTGAALLEAGERYVYALCRPPGHHAERRVFGGFCYFNNAAIAAHRLARRGRVALLDIDYHHGNGSQDIFWARDDVVVASIHGHPSRAYPYFSGFADEVGEGPGKGLNRNYPLAEAITDATYLEVLEQALAFLVRSRPWALVLSIGFDTMKGDPTGDFVLSPAGLEAVGARLHRLDLPVLAVQEGGYALRNLKSGARRFFAGLLAPQRR